MKTKFDPDFRSKITKASNVQILEAASEASQAIGIFHSVRVEEQVAFADWINRFFSGYIRNKLGQCMLCTITARHVNFLSRDFLSILFEKNNPYKCGDFNVFDVSGHKKLKIHHEVRLFLKNFAVLMESLYIFVKFCSK